MLTFCILSKRISLKKNIARKNCKKIIKLKSCEKKYLCKKTGPPYVILKVVHCLDIFQFIQPIYFKLLKQLFDTKN